jgi:hypothetical protein
VLLRAPPCARLAVAACSQRLKSRRERSDELTWLVGCSWERVLQERDVSTIQLIAYTRAQDSRDD